MGQVVTGISQDGNIKQLESMLKSAGFPLDPLQLISPTDSDLNLPDDVKTGLPLDTALFTGGGQGTGVPGLSGGGGATVGVGSRDTFFRNEAMGDRLGDLEIPDSEVENYIEALAAGRSIVAYFARPDNQAKIVEIFRSSGLAKIKTF